MRAAAVLLTVLMTGYLLQFGDQGGPSVALHRIVIPVQANGATASASGREYFFTHLEVVPVGRRNITLPILMYHYVRNPPSMRDDLFGYKLSVSPADFTAQMDWLSGHRFHPVDFNDVRAYFAGQQPLPANPVVITFDDGYADLYTTAFPILPPRFQGCCIYRMALSATAPRAAVAGRAVDQNGIEIALPLCFVTREPGELSSNASLMHELVDSRIAGEPSVIRADFAYPSGETSTRRPLQRFARVGYDTRSRPCFDRPQRGGQISVWTAARRGGSR